jgi:uncharacterized delta-60 repeat protein
MTHVAARQDRLHRRWSVAARTGIGLGLATVGAAVLAPGADARPGDADRTFGRAGVATVSFGYPDSSATSVAIQPNGRIVAAGITGTGRRLLIAVTRLRRDGRLDRSFGGDGRVTTRLPDRQCVSARDVALQPDGKIVLVGRSGCSGGRFAVVRYRRDGRLDPSFGHGGMVTTRPSPDRCPAEAYAVALQRDGRLIVVGKGGCRPGFAVARYTADGRLDRSFSGDGRVITRFSSSQDFAFDVAVQTDGAILVAGTAGYDSGDFGEFALARYRPDGQLDPSFGTGGKVAHSFAGEQACGPAEAYAMGLGPDGRIVLAGWAGCGHLYFAVARYLGTGALDPSFGADGRVATEFYRDGCSERVFDLAIQRDARIVVAGVAGCRRPSPGFALARFQPDGSLDRSFGHGGKVTKRLSSGDCFAELEAVGVQANGRIVAAGTSACRHSRFSVLRWLGR